VVRGTALDHKSVYHMILSQTAKYGDRVLLRRKKDGAWKPVTWNDFSAEAEKVALALIRLGVGEGRAVGILSESRVEWVFSDMGIIAAGAITTAAYPSSPPPGVAYVLGHAECGVVFAENKLQLGKVIGELPNLPDLKNIVVYDTAGVEPHPMVISFDEFLAMGASAGDDVRAEWRRRVDSMSPEKIITYIYTSGTTGPPKGAMLTHANVLFICKTCVDLNMVLDKDRSLSFLPLAHALERVIFCVSLAAGGEIYFAESIYKIAENMIEARPNVLVGVPRVYEKIYERIMANVGKSTPLKKKIFHWAVGVGKKVSYLRNRGKPIPVFLLVEQAIADALVFKKLRAVAGGRIRWLGCGGAPLSPNIEEFFCAVGMPVIQAYGLTETCAPSVIVPLGAVRIGRVGKKLKNVDVKIADDGEILIRGPNVFKGYFKNEQATRDAFEDGWFKSGDLGRFDEEGYLEITGRKKDLLITAGGKNISPSNLEHHFSSIPLVGQIIVCGDSRPYLTALLTLNEEELKNFAKERGLSREKDVPLQHHPEAIKYIEARIEEKNKELPKYETIKKFRVIAHEFTEDSGEMTPTMKIKRNVVFKRYADLIDSMYE
jgi:long-chain acyl-CoA synthetase